MLPSFVKLVLLFCTLAVLSQAQLLDDPTLSNESPQDTQASYGDSSAGVVEPKAVAPGVISFAMRLKWASLWNENATLDEVPDEERLEYIEEALNEIAQKMKRKHKVKTMRKYKLLERKDDAITVEYPNLKVTNDAELKQLAL